MDKIELRTADEPAEPDKRSQLAVESKTQWMHVGPECLERGAPVSLPAQICHGHGHPRRALMLDEVEQVVLRAAAVDPGDDMKNTQGRFHARRSSGSAGAGRDEAELD